jgi:SAM-dependent methyltransferase
MRSAVRTLRSQRLRRSTDGVSPAGVPLPPRAFRMGGKHFLDDGEFVQAGRRDVARLAEHGLTQESRILDWGCGAGRLAIGLIETWGTIARYDGIDVQRDLVDWASRHVARGSIRFELVHNRNARYNRGGSPERAIPGEDASYDALYGYSVLSHMDSQELTAYLTEIRRLLNPTGFAWLTAFVEDGVPDESENPEGYGPIPWEGAHHCVRFSRDFFESAVRQAGCDIDVFIHGQETDGQSLYVLRRA